ncbi:hypothetical protein HDA32_005519 [Spinactinospora alkalitolerans]|uniref:Uncharacterized protein n=1 Tax=Spinactinospora alkalitolerans TaxID=687207 RepID=A0A852U2H2_9ACTN|nr:hypothetical protein [Spinactinospora alkalitolerans]NYE50399.1 hypothetical protein [Spinactinospora alkalitolerans]
MSEPLGHEPEPEHTDDRGFAPVLRDEDEPQASDRARAQGRKVTGTGVPTPVPADGGSEARSDLEGPPCDDSEPALDRDPD